MNEPLAIHEFADGGVEAAIVFLDRTRNELRMLRLVRIWKDRFQIVDINGDSFEVRGIGYEDADILPLLNHVNTNYNPETIHAPTDDEYKQYKTGRRYPWAQDRVM